MKILTSIVLSLCIVCALTLMTGCTMDKPTETSKTMSANSQSKSSAEVIEVLKSDPLPASWKGLWTCTYSEANYFKKDETIQVKDFDNAVLYTNLGGSKPFVDNRWFCFNKTTNTIDIFNEEVFDKRYIRDTFVVKKESATELVMTRKSTGQEVRFNKTK